MVDLFYALTMKLPANQGEVEHACDSSHDRNFSQLKPLNLWQILLQLFQLTFHNLLDSGYRNDATIFQFSEICFPLHSSRSMSTSYFSQLLYNYTPLAMVRSKMGVKKTGRSKLGLG